MRRITLLSCCLLMTFATSVYAQEQSAPAPIKALSAEVEIDLLITKVEAGTCSFHRNGKTHSAAAAAKHLRLKLSRGARHAKTTENFIERLASKSSFSGKPYYIECQPGQLNPMATWLNAELLVIRNNQ